MLESTSKWKAISNLIIVIPFYKVRETASKETLEPSWIILQIIRRCKIKKIKKIRISAINNHIKLRGNWGCIDWLWNISN